MLVDKKRPGYVLFLTDGLPTVGERNELKIAAHARAANTVNARVYSFGVGFDVNSRLLDRLSRDHRGQSVYVRPNEDIEVQVSKLYDRIGAPLLTDLAVGFEFDEVARADARAPITRTYPRELTDLFRGEQLVWVGRYRRSGHVKVTLHGTNGDDRMSFSFATTLAAKSPGKSTGFVAKLWALRRIGEIIDELDLNGTNKELIDELVRLSIAHGVMTPYTSFLADEDVNLASRDNLDRTRVNVNRELAKSSGRAGFSQRRIKGRFQQATNVPAATASPSPLADADAAAGFPAGGPPPKNRQTVRNIGQKSFFRKQDQWRDSTVTAEQEKRAIRVTQYSKKYFELASSNGGTLAKYLVFNETVLVNLGNQTYLIEPPEAP
jgi:Ca-activated chloride channel family protein